MEIIEYKNTFDEPMILIIDEKANWAKSMTKLAYDEMIAAQENQPTIEVTND
jgi:hypothetical protein